MHASSAMMDSAPVNRYLLFDNVQEFRASDKVSYAIRHADDYSVILQRHDRQLKGVEGTFASRTMRTGEGEFGRPKTNTRAASATSSKGAATQYTLSTGGGTRRSIGPTSNGSLTHPGDAQRGTPSQRIAVQTDGSDSSNDSPSSVSPPSTTARTQATSQTDARSTRLPSAATATGTATATAQGTPVGNFSVFGCGGGAAMDSSKRYLIRSLEEIQRQLFAADRFASSPSSGATFHSNPVGANRAQSWRGEDRSFTGGGFDVGSDDVSVGMNSMGMYSPQTISTVPTPVLDDLDDIDRVPWENPSIMNDLWSWPIEALYQHYHVVFAVDFSRSSFEVSRNGVLFVDRMASAIAAAVYALQTAYATRRKEKMLVSEFLNDQVVDDEVRAGILKQIWSPDIVISVVLMNAPTVNHGGMNATECAGGSSNPRQSADGPAMFPPHAVPYACAESVTPPSSQAFNSACGNPPTATTPHGGSSSSSASVGFVVNLFGTSSSNSNTSGNASTQAYGGGTTAGSDHGYAGSANFMRNGSMYGNASPTIAGANNATNSAMSGAAGGMNAHNTSSAAWYRATGGAPNASGGNLSPDVTIPLLTEYPITDETDAPNLIRQLAVSFNSYESSYRKVLETAATADWPETAIPSTIEQLFKMVPENALRCHSVVLISNASDAGVPETVNFLEETAKRKNIIFSYLTLNRQQSFVSPYLSPLTRVIGEIGGFAINIDYWLALAAPRLNADWCRRFEGRRCLVQQLFVQLVSRFPVVIPGISKRYGLRLQAENVQESSRRPLYNSEHILSDMVLPASAMRTLRSVAESRLNEGWSVVLDVGDDAGVECHLYARNTHKLHKGTLTLHYEMDVNAPVVYRRVDVSGTASLVDRFLRFRTDDRATNTITEGDRLLWVTYLAILREQLHSWIQTEQCMLNLLCASTYPASRFLSTDVKFLSCSDGVSFSWMSHADVISFPLYIECTSTEVGECTDPATSSAAGVTKTEVEEADDSPVGATAAEQQSVLTSSRYLECMLDVNGDSHSRQLHKRSQDRKHATVRPPLPMPSPHHALEDGRQAAVSHSSPHESTRTHIQRHVVESGTAPNPARPSETVGDMITALLELALNGGDSACTTSRRTRYRKIVDGGATMFLRILDREDDDGNDNDGDTGKYADGTTSEYGTRSTPLHIVQFFVPPQSSCLGGGSTGVQSTGLCVTMAEVRVSFFQSTLASRQVIVRDITAAIQQEAKLFSKRPDHLVRVNVPLYSIAGCSLNDTIAGSTDCGHRDLAVVRRTLGAWWPESLMLACDWGWSTNGQRQQQSSQQQPQRRYWRRSQVKQTRSVDQLLSRTLTDTFVLSDWSHMPGSATLRWNITSETQNAQFCKDAFPFLVARRLKMGFRLLHLAENGLLAVLKRMPTTSRGTDAPQDTETDATTWLDAAEVYDVLELRDVSSDYVSATNSMILQSPLQQQQQGKYGAVNGNPTLGSNCRGAKSVSAFQNTDCRRLAQLPGGPIGGGDASGKGGGWRNEPLSAMAQQQQQQVVSYPSGIRAGIVVQRHIVRYADLFQQYAADQDKHDSLDYQLHADMSADFVVCTIKNTFATLVGGQMSSKGHSYQNMSRRNAQRTSSQRQQHGVEFSMRNDDQDDIATVSKGVAQTRLLGIHALPAVLTDAQQRGAVESVVVPCELSSLVGCVAATSCTVLDLGLPDSLARDDTKSFFRLRRAIHHMIRCLGSQNVVVSHNVLKAEVVRLLTGASAVESADFLHSLRADDASGLVRVSLVHRERSNALALVMVAVGSPIETDTDGACCCQDECASGNAPVSSKHVRVLLASLNHDDVNHELASWYATVNASRSEANGNASAESGDVDVISAIRDLLRSFTGLFGAQELLRRCDACDSNSDALLKDIDTSFASFSECSTDIDVSHLLYVLDSQAGNASQSSPSHAEAQLVTDSISSMITKSSAGMLCPLPGMSSAFRYCLTPSHDARGSRRRIRHHHHHHHHNRNGSCDCSGSGGMSNPSCTPPAGAVTHRPHPNDSGTSVAGVEGANQGVDSSDFERRDVQEQSATEKTGSSDSGEGEDDTNSNAGATREDGTRVVLSSSDREPRQSSSSALLAVSIHSLSDVDEEESIRRIALSATPQAFASRDTLHRHRWVDSPRRPDGQLSHAQSRSHNDDGKEEQASLDAWYIPTVFRAVVEINRRSCVTSGDSGNVTWVRWSQDESVVSSLLDNSTVWAPLQPVEDATGLSDATEHHQRDAADDTLHDDSSGHSTATLRVRLLVRTVPPDLVDLCRDNFRPPKEVVESMLQTLLFRAQSRSETSHSAPRQTHIDPSIISSELAMPEDIEPTPSPAVAQPDISISIATSSQSENLRNAPNKSWLVDQHLDRKSVAALFAQCNRSSALPHGVARVVSDFASLFAQRVAEHCLASTILTTTFESIQACTGQEKGDSPDTAEQVCDVNSADANRTIRDVYTSLLAQTDETTLQNIENVDGIVPLISHCIAPSMLSCDAFHRRRFAMEFTRQANYRGNVDPTEAALDVLTRRLGNERICIVPAAHSCFLYVPNKRKLGECWVLIRLDSDKDTGVHTITLYSNEAVMAPSATTSTTAAPMGFHGWNSTKTPKLSYSTASVCEALEHVIIAKTMQVSQLHLLKELRDTQHASEELIPVGWGTQFHVGASAEVNYTTSAAASTAGGLVNNNNNNNNRTFACRVSSGESSGSGHTPPLPLYNTAATSTQIRMMQQQQQQLHQYQKLSVATPSIGGTPSPPTTPGMSQNGNICSTCYYCSGATALEVPLYYKLQHQCHKVLTRIANNSVRLELFTIYNRDQCFVVCDDVKRDVFHYIRLVFAKETHQYIPTDAPPPGLLLSDLCPVIVVQVFSAIEKPSIQRVLDKLKDFCYQLAVQELQAYLGYVQHKEITQNDLVCLQNVKREKFAVSLKSDAKSVPVVPPAQLAALARVLVVLSLTEHKFKAFVVKEDALPTPSRFLEFYELASDRCVSGIAESKATAQQNGAFLRFFKVVDTAVDVLVSCTVHINDEACRVQCFHTKLPLERYSGSDMETLILQQLASCVCDVETQLRYYTAAATMQAPTFTPLHHLQSLSKKLISTASKMHGTAEATVLRYESFPLEDVSVSLLPYLVETITGVLARFSPLCCEQRIEDHDPQHVPSFPWRWRERIQGDPNADVSVFYIACGFRFEDTSLRCDCESPCRTRVTPVSHPDYELISTPALEQTGPPSLMGDNPISILVRLSLCDGLSAVVFNLRNPDTLMRLLGVVINEAEQRSRLLTDLALQRMGHPIRSTFLVSHLGNLSRDSESPAAKKRTVNVVDELPSRRTTYMRFPTLQIESEGGSGEGRSSSPGMATSSSGNISTLPSTMSCGSLSDVASEDATFKLVVEGLCNRGLMTNFQFFREDAVKVLFDESPTYAWGDCERIVGTMVEHEYFTEVPTTSRPFSFTGLQSAASATWVAPVQRNDRGGQKSIFLKLSCPDGIPAEVLEADDYQRHLHMACTLIEARNARADVEDLLERLKSLLLRPRQLRPTDLATTVCLLLQLSKQIHGYRVPDLSLRSERGSNTGETVPDDVLPRGTHQGQDYCRSIDTTLAYYVRHLERVFPKMRMVKVNPSDANVLSNETIVNRLRYRYGKVITRDGECIEFTPVLYYGVLLVSDYVGRGGGGGSADTSMVKDGRHHSYRNNSNTSHHHHPHGSSISGSGVHLPSQRGTVPGAYSLHSENRLAESIQSQQHHQQQQHQQHQSLNTVSQGCAEEDTIAQNGVFIVELGFQGINFALDFYLIGGNELSSSASSRLAEQFQRRFMFDSVLYDLTVSSMLHFVKLNWAKLPGEQHISLALMNLVRYYSQPPSQSLNVVTRYDITNRRILKFANRQRKINRLNSASGVAVDAGDLVMFIVPERNEHLLGESGDLRYNFNGILVYETGQLFVMIATENDVLQCERRSSNTMCLTALAENATRYLLKWLLDRIVQIDLLSAWAKMFAAESPAPHSAEQQTSEPHESTEDSDHEVGYPVLDDFQLITAHKPRRTLESHEVGSLASLPIDWLVVLLQQHRHLLTQVHNSKRSLPTEPKRMLEETEWHGVYMEVEEGKKYIIHVFFSETHTKQDEGRVCVAERGVEPLDSPTQQECGYLNDTVTELILTISSCDDERKAALASLSVRSRGDGFSPPTIALYRSTNDASVPSNSVLLATEDELVRVLVSKMLSAAWSCVLPRGLSTSIASALSPPPASPHTNEATSQRLKSWPTSPTL